MFEQVEKTDLCTFIQQCLCKTILLIILHFVCQAIKLRHHMTLIIPPSSHGIIGAGDVGVEGDMSRDVREGSRDMREGSRDMSEGSRVMQWYQPL